MISRKLSVLVLILALTVIVASCNGNATPGATSSQPDLSSVQSPSSVEVADDFYTGLYREQSAVKLEGISPDWVKSLVIAQMRIETISKEGTFTAAIPALDYLQDLGVNGVWISPVFEKGIDEDTINFDKINQNGFIVKEPDKIEPSLGTEAELVALVEEAHRRNIRVFLDVVPHGVSTLSSLVAEHPDWFRRDADGELDITWGKMHDFIFRKTAVEEYWINTCVALVKRLNIDGFRCDLEPGCFGLMTWGTIRQKCWDAGYKIVIFSEGVSDRGAGFDFDQNGIYPFDLTNESKRLKYRADLFLKENVVDAVQQGLSHGTFQKQALGEGGQERFYSFALSQHDMIYTTKGSRLRFAYQAIFTPYIPVFFIGEEMNHDMIGGLLYVEPIDLSQAEQPGKKELRADIRKMISIRREYNDIFEYFPENHRDANIVKVETTGTNIQAYARYRNNRAVIIVGNNSDAAITANVTLDPVSMELAEASEYIVTDLMTGTVLYTGAAEGFSSQVVDVDPQSLRVLKVEPK
ncbi:MAG: alpha-amylase family glycosyl hydrolase [Saccharofermentanales bacterium]